jgi:hypothetical protein
LIRDSVIVFTARLRIRPHGWSRLGCGNHVPVEHIDDILALLMSFPALPELQEVPGLDFEQAALDRCDAPT